MRIVICALIFSILCGFVTANDKIDQLEVLVNTLRSDLDIMKEQIKSQGEFPSKNIIDKKSKVLIPDEIIFELKGKLDQEDKCECNLTDIEHDIRQNGIEIAKVRHLVVLNGYHISDNLDNINQNKIEVDTRINALEVSISDLNIETEASITIVKTNLENSINFLQSNLENSIDSLKLDLQNDIDENSNLIADTRTHVDVSKNAAKIRTSSMLSFRLWKPLSIPV